MPKFGSDKLFHLIKSLTPAEKRCFKRFAANNFTGGAFNYVKLFNALDAQKEYDEQKILSSEKYIVQLPQLKNYLCELILKSLDFYSGDNTSEKKIRKLLRYVEIAYGKGLYGQCEEMLDKAKRLAARYNKYLQLLEILNWNFILLQAQGFVRDSDPGLSDLIQEEEMISGKLINAQRYRGVRYKLLKHHLLYNIARNRKEVGLYKKVISNDLCTDDNRALSFEAKCDFYYINGLYHSSVGYLTGSYDYQQKLIGLLEKNPERIDEKPTRYLSDLANYFQVCYLLGKYGECSVIINKIRSVPARTIRTEVLIFRISHLRELELYLKTGEHHKGIILIGKIEEVLDTYGDKIRNTHIVEFHFLIAKLYFGTGDIPLSLARLNKIFNDPELKNSRIDIHCFAQIMNLIVHYELGNTGLLEYTVKSTYRFLFKRDRIYKVESSILQFVRVKLPKIRNNRDLITAFKELKTQLEEIIKDPFEKQALEYFDFIAWAESKITGVAFADIVRQKTMPIAKIYPR